MSASELKVKQWDYNHDKHFKNSSQKNRNSKPHSQTFYDHNYYANNSIKKGETSRKRYCLFLNNKLIPYSSSKIKGHSRHRHKKSLQQRKRMSLKQYINDELSELSLCKDYNILCRHSPNKHSVFLKSDHKYRPCGGKYINYYPKHSSIAINRAYLKTPIFYNIQFGSRIHNKFKWLLICSCKSCSEIDVKIVENCINENAEKLINHHEIYYTLKQNKSETEVDCDLVEQYLLYLSQMTHKNRYAVDHEIPVIFYSGHGDDAQFEIVGDETLGLQDILKHFDPEKPLILILNTCYAASFFDKKGDKKVEKILNEYKKVIIFAASELLETAKCSRYESNGAKSFTRWMFAGGKPPDHQPLLYLNGKRQKLSKFPWYKI